MTRSLRLPVALPVALWAARADTPPESNTAAAAEPRPTGDLPTLSAVICTHGRPAQLRRALASLALQQPAPHEILVVDNAPAGDSAERVVLEFAGARYLCEPVPGLDFARNRALAEARGEIVAFLDDDAVADAEWALALAGAFRSERTGACTGRVEALSLGTEGARIVEANGGYARGRERRMLPRDATRRLHGLPVPLIAWALNVGSGCTLAVRRELALALGGFDEALDLGRALPGGGDHDMLWRVLMAGHDVVYEPAALAHHEHRAGAAAAHQQIVGHQRALVALLVKTVWRARGAHRAGTALYLAWRLVRPGVRLARRLIWRDPLPAAVLLRMWGACWAGLGAYGAARRTAQRRRAEWAHPGQHQR